MAESMGTLFADNSGIKAICEKMKAFCEERLKMHLEKARQSVERLFNMSEGTFIDHVKAAIETVAHMVLALIDAFGIFLNTVLGFIADIFSTDEQFSNQMTMPSGSGG